MAQLTNTPVIGQNGQTTNYSGDSAGLAGYQASVGAPGSAPPPVAPPTTPPPAPAPSTPPATAPTSAPQQGANSASQPMAQNTGQNPQGTLTMPANGSVVDLLNGLGQPSDVGSRAQLAQSFGIPYDVNATGKNSAAQNTDLAKKYIEAHNSMGKTDAPQSGAEGRMAVQNYLNEDQNQPEQDPEKSFAEQYFAMNPVAKTLYDQITQQLSTSATKQTYEEEFTKAYSDTAIPAGLPGESLSQEQVKLMNIKNIMDGTEDDIRTEIGKAGGFATESQIGALTTARNKTLLKQATILQDSMTLKQDYVDHLMQYSEKDRAQVDKKISDKIGLTEKLSTLQDKISTAANDNYSQVITKMGYNGLYQSLQGDPHAVRTAEQSLGMPAGSLKQLAASTPHDVQFISATDNQPGGIFDKTTNKFTPTGGGGGTGNGNPPVPTDNPYAGILNTILGSGKFTKDQTKQISTAILSGQDPFTVVKNNAKNILQNAEATKLSAYEAADNSMRDLKSSLNDYYDAGGDTGLLSGTMEQVYNKLGQVKDPAKVSLATQVAVSLQAYRNAISGTAYSNQEGQQINAIFPGINRSHGLNDAIIDGRLTADQSLIDGIYRTALGPAYDELKQVHAGGDVGKKGKLSNSEFVSKAVDASGQAYDAIISGAKKGQIAVVDNKTGQIGYIPVEEYNDSTYTRM